MKIIYNKSFTSKDNIIEILTFLLICVVISIWHEYDSAVDQPPTRVVALTAELLLEKSR